MKIIIRSILYAIAMIVVFAVWWVVSCLIDIYCPAWVCFVWYLIPIATVMTFLFYYLQTERIKVSVSIKRNRK